MSSFYSSPKDASGKLLAVIIGASLALVICLGLYFHFANQRERAASATQQEQVAPATTEAPTEVGVSNKVSAKVARDAILSQMGFDTNGGHRVVIEYQYGRGTSNATTKLVQ